MKSYQIKRIVDNILRERKEQKELVESDFDKFAAEMVKEYEDFSFTYPGIFHGAIEGKLDSTIFMKMIQMLEQIELKKQTEKNASVKIGEILVDKYVKPLMKDKGLDKKSKK